MEWMRARHEEVAAFAANSEGLSEGAIHTNAGPGRRTAWGATVRWFMAPVSDRSPPVPAERRSLGPCPLLGCLLPVRLAAWNGRRSAESEMAAVDAEVVENCRSFHFTFVSCLCRPNAGAQGREGAAPWRRLKRPSGARC